MSFFSSMHVHEELYLKPKGQNVNFVRKYSINLQAIEFARTLNNSAGSGWVESELGSTRARYTMSLKLGKSSARRRLEKSKAPARLGLDADELESPTSLFQAFRKMSNEPITMSN